MSLQYIIDGYNIINHPRFSQRITKSTKDSRRFLLEFIRLNRLCGSPKNRVTVVFDGQTDLWDKDDVDKTNINVIFSQRDTADEKIKRLVEAASNPKNIVVVSDDKEIKSFVKSVGARSMGVEEFIQSKETALREKEDSSKVELTYSQMQKINQELKKIWLK